LWLSMIVTVMMRTAHQHRAGIGQACLLIERDVKP
jgi:hypothetical protein